MFKGILKRQPREGPKKSINIIFNPSKVENAIPIITREEKRLQDLIGTTVDKQSEDKIIYTSCPPGTAYDPHCAGDVRRHSRYRCKKIEETPVKCYDESGEFFVYARQPVSRIPVTKKDGEMKKYIPAYKKALQEYFNVHPEDAELFQVRYKTIDDLARFMFGYYSERKKFYGNGMPESRDPVRLGQVLVYFAKDTVAEENAWIARNQEVERQRRQAIEHKQRSQRTQKTQKTQRAQASQRSDKSPAQDNQDDNPLSASWVNLQQDDDWVFEPRKSEKPAAAKSLEIPYVQRPLKTSLSGKKCLDRCNMRRINALTAKFGCACRVEPYKKYGIEYDWDYCNSEDCR